MSKFYQFSKFFTCNNGGSYLNESFIKVYKAVVYQYHLTVVEGCAVFVLCGWAVEPTVILFHRMVLENVASLPFPLKALAVLIENRYSAKT